MEDKEICIQEAVSAYIYSKTPTQTKIILMSVVGSRGKNMSSGEASDYDLKVVVLYPTKHYLLQKIKPVIKKDWPTIQKCPQFDNLKVNELECSIICLHQFTQWCVLSNQAAYDILFTPIHLLKDYEKVEELKKLFTKAFALNIEHTKGLN